MQQRIVDWEPWLGPDAPEPIERNGAASSELASLLSALDELTALSSADAMLKRAVELARERVGFTRVSIFLLNETLSLMQGTWGTDFDGATVDEHGICFQSSQSARVFDERLARAGVHWTVVDNAPLVAHQGAETRTNGRGWVCCTPIRTGAKLVGIMYNDAGASGAPIDDRKQAEGAVLCSLLGSALSLTEQRPVPKTPPARVRSRSVQKAREMLASDPSLTSLAMGSRLRLSPSRMARLFKAEMGMSLVEYRNRLRLERFFGLLEQDSDNLLEAALKAGFGSYAQFHRVFMAERGTTPGKFLRARNEKNSRHQ